jgi:hypothetical protein
MGDPTAPRGTLPWVRYVFEQAKIALNDASTMREHVQSQVSALRTGDHFRLLTDSHGRNFFMWEMFTTTDQPHGLGYDQEAIDAIIAERKTIAQRDAEDQRRQRPTGRPPKTGNNVPNSTKRPEGNTAEKGLRRLRKDRPDLHQRVLAGELSAHAAMVLAGFRTKTITVPAEPRSLAAGLLRQLAPEDLAILLTELRAHSEQGHHGETVTGDSRSAEAAPVLRAGGPARLVQHSAVFGRVETEVREFRVGDVYRYGESSHSVGIDFVEPGKSQHYAFTMRTDGERYLTVEMAGQTVYDSRIDVPIDMDKWHETDVRFQTRRSLSLVGGDA